MCALSPISPVLVPYLARLVPISYTMVLLCPISRNNFPLDVRFSETFPVDLKLSATHVQQTSDYKPTAAVKHLGNTSTFKPLHAWSVYLP